MTAKSYNVWNHGKIVFLTNDLEEARDILTMPTMGGAVIAYTQKAIVGINNEKE